MIDPLDEPRAQKLRVLITPDAPSHGTPKQEIRALITAELEKRKTSVAPPESLEDAITRTRNAQE